ncbi:FG-GAP repeat domain-containing protein [Pseudorhodobacter ferrugineus]|uniref:FG-GAP repeat domain-containing protein n=1 Tax=Pseudorhodobacter ferrugineus TaxID=77008 RepID=UPI0003B549FB|nr:VCBS repeat-containing protein [Pseudorhodobacter ferrugineus]
MKSVFCAALLFAGVAQAQVSGAALTQATDRYDHAILGDALEWGGLRISGPAGAIEVTLPQSRVFEDIEARVADLDGDGAAEVLVVETDIARGASLAVYDAQGWVTATPFIGRTHRWLAPLGIGDMDGDGLPEIAYVDRPHLARELVIVQYRGRKLVEIVRISGLTNHRIGDATIAGGIRNCGQGGEAVLANADWSQLMAVRLDAGTLVPRALGPYSPRAMAQALACKG